MMRMSQCFHQVIHWKHTKQFVYSYQKRPMLICTFLSTGNMIEAKQLHVGACLGLMMGQGHGASREWLTVWTYVLQPRGGAENCFGLLHHRDQDGRGTTDRCRCDQFIFATEQNWPVILSCLTECFQCSLFVTSLGSIDHHVELAFRGSYGLCAVLSTLCVLSHLTLMAAYEVCIIATPSVKGDRGTLPTAAQLKMYPRTYLNG